MMRKSSKGRRVHKISQVQRSNSKGYSYSTEIVKNEVQTRSLPQILWHLQTTRILPVSQFFHVTQKDRLTVDSYAFRGYLRPS